ncbi:MAG: transposase, partial [Clostridia bacterium]|nr:transposase [Clostridia bacterium]
MAVRTKRKNARKATAMEVQALETEYMRLEAGGGLDAGCEDGSTVYADLPDEVKDNLARLDFSILRRELMEVNILDHEAIMMLSMDQLLSYVEELEKTLRFYVQGYMDLSEELANAQGLILNQQNTIFGRSSQRSSALFGKVGKEDGNGGKSGEQEEAQATGGNGENMPEKEASSPGTETPGTDAASVSSPASGPEEPGQEGGENPGQEGKEKKKPKRSAGCAEKVYKDAEVCHIDCTIPEEKLDGLFGSSGWKEVPGAERRSTEYTIIPAKIIIRIYHLHAYCAADSTDPDVKGMVRAKLPIVRPRAKSPLSTGLLAHILYERNSKRIPVDRICGCISSNGLDLTPQRVYENMGYYARYFSILCDLLWTMLLSSHYIQVDETPVRYYDKKEKKMKRGYLWVFTTSEMLLDGR